MDTPLPKNSTTQTVAELREKTGAGLLDCKKALDEAKGNLEEAITILRKKGAASAAKKAERATKEGVIESYIHVGGKVGVLIEVNCETDFVARNEAFRAFVKDLCLQIAAANPLYVSRDQVPEADLAKEREIAAASVLGKGVACWAAARLNGEDQPTSLAVGTLMNSRGLMELIILNIGLQNGFIESGLFSVMVLMAIVTTLMTSPLFEWVYGRKARLEGRLGATR